LSNPNPQAAKASNPTLTDLHNANVGFMNRLRDVTSTIARIRKAFTDKYSGSLDAVNTMTRRRRGRVLVIPRLISDLHTFLRPLLDFFPLDLERGFRRLDLFTLSLLWQLPPSATAISRMKRITEATLTSRLLNYGRIPFTPFVLWRPFPSPPDVMRTTIEETRHISDLSARIQKPTPSFSIRIVPSKGQRAAFPPETVEAVREGETFGRGTREVTSTLLKTEALVGLSEKLSPLTEWPSTLVSAQRLFIPREVVTAYGVRVRAPVSQLYEAYEAPRLAGRPPVGEVMGAARFPQPIPREVFEAYTLRIQIPASKAREAPRSVHMFPLTEVIEAAPPIVPDFVKRGHELGLGSPQGLEELGVWPSPEISQMTADGTTIRATGRPPIKGLGGAFEAPRYRIAIRVAGKPAIESLRRETRIILPPFKQTARDVLSSVVGLRMTDIVEAAASPQSLAREMLTAYGVRVRAPVSQLYEAYEAPRLAGRPPVGEVMGAARFPQPDLLSPRQLLVDVVKVRGPGFPSLARVGDLRPLPGGEAKLLDRTFPRPESPSFKVLPDQTEIPQFDEGAGWSPSMGEAFKVARSRLGRLSHQVLGEVARRLAAIPPLVKAVTEAAQPVPRPSAVASRTDWLMTPVSPLLMELGFGITEAKQLYPAVEAVSGARRAFDASRVLPREALTDRAGTEEVVERLVGLLHAPVERYTLERIPLEAPRAFSTVKLPEMMSLIASMRTPTRPERPPRSERVKARERPRSIEVKVEPPRDERDLRELRRKITRILRDEARRHGVY
jgi:hypothetical protein